MKLSQLFPAALSIAMITPCVARAQNLNAVLAKLDEASAKFVSVQADVRYDNYTKVVRDHEIQNGSIVIQRAGHMESMGALMYEPGSTTPSKVLVYDGGTLHVYSPGVNQEDVFSAGANQAKYESFLTLGFGGSGKALAANWTITDQGTDNVGGVACEKLDLVGKDASVRNMFTHVTVWIDATRGVSLRQIFYQPNGDTRTADYSNIRLHAPVDAKKYAIKTYAKGKPQVIQH